ncbi:MAG: GntR family transcriptional regulator [Kiritimatiellae bacterium]|nr:GntR family transcriptional regulator [Kiritimatiellia bacterium]
MDNPKYREIFRTLRNEILAGKYDNAQHLPSENQLVRRFGASRSTMIRVMLELQKYGLVERRRGSGTYLSPMARNSTGCLGLIIPGHRNVEIFAPICAEIARVSREEGYTILFGDASSSDPMERVRQAQALAADYARRHVAGVFFEPIELCPDSRELSQEILSILNESHIPVVLLDRDIVSAESRSGYDLVGIGNIRAGRTLADHLISQGARDIRFFMPPHSAPTIFQRCEGVAASVSDAGLPWNREKICIALPEDVERVRRLFRKGKSPDALVCGNDRTAARLLQTLGVLGKRVPDDVMLCGFDDVACARLLSPPLTSMRQPCEEIAAVAVRTLLERIRTPSLPIREICLEAKLVPRDSTKCRASREL